MTQDEAEAHRGISFGSCLEWTVRSPGACCLSSCFLVLVLGSDPNKLEAVIEAHEFLIPVHQMSRPAEQV